MERTALRGGLKWQTATVTSVTKETASVVEREYSIASAPGEPVAITVERLDDGEVSPYLTEELRAGDELELRGPIGG